MSSKKRPLNLIFRGHIRSSFEEEKLRELTREIFEQFDTKMYIQTWNIIQNGISWRSNHKNTSKIPPIKEINKKVCSGFVEGYFLPMKAKKIIVIDDSKINHIGATEGFIGRTKCPVLGWKNMYKGMLVASSEVLKQENPETPTVQMRIDILNNPFSPKKNEILDFLNREYDQAINNKKEKIRFLKMKCFFGVDNIFMAKLIDIHRFILYMYYDMDRIIQVHKNTKNQEHIAFHERNSFFEFIPSVNFMNRFLTSDKIS